MVYPNALKSVNIQSKSLESLRASIINIIGLSVEKFMISLDK